MLIWMYSDIFILSQAFRLKCFIKKLSKTPTQHIILNWSILKIILVFIMIYTIIFI